ncbi:MAG: carboxypeptidase regulatory-like domain-containing protein [Planctomycetes bacterium]|nr:carboxypeptidase regulatory-like domain-containing protein [Planctomycetota bacterium]
MNPFLPLLTVFATTFQEAAAPRVLVAAEPATAQAAVTGTAKGRVRFEGEVPERKPLAIEPERAKGCTPEGESIDTKDESLLIGKENGIANVVLTVEVADVKAKAPEKPVLMDQKKCRFEPHVVVIPAGATVEFLNSDQAPHNVHIFPLKNEPFNQTVAVGAKHTATFPKTDKIQIKCDLHPWMKSWLIVTDTPFVAVTDADGNFEIAGLPPGEHKATLWHEELGKAQVTIAVGADGKVAPLEFKLSQPKKDGRARR